MLYVNLKFSSRAFLSRRNNWSIGGDCSEMSKIMSLTARVTQKFADAFPAAI
jgi:hypothetical protein